MANMFANLVDDEVESFNMFADLAEEDTAEDIVAPPASEPINIFADPAEDIVPEQQELAPEQLPEIKPQEVKGLGPVYASEGKMAKSTWADEVAKLEKLKDEGAQFDPIHNKPIDERINFAKMESRREIMAGLRKKGVSAEDVEKWDDTYSWYERYITHPGKKSWHKLLMAGEARDMSRNLESIQNFEKVQRFMQEAQELPTERGFFESGSTRSDRIKLASRKWHTQVAPDLENCEKCMSIWQAQDKGTSLSGQPNMPDFTPEFTDAVTEHYEGKAQKRLLNVIKQRIELGKIPEDQAVQRLVTEMDSGNYGAAFDAFLDSPLGIIWNTSLESLGVSAPALIEGAAGGFVMGPFGVAAGVANGSFQVDYALELMGRFEEAGIDFSQKPEDIIAQMRDPKVFEEVSKGATNHAALVATFDAITGGLATKIIAPKAITSTGGRVAFSTVVTQPQIQGFGGLFGEAAGQLAADGEITSKGELVLEYLGEFGGAPVEVAALRSSIREQKGKDAIAGNAQEVIDKINETLGTDFTNLPAAYDELKLREGIATSVEAETAAEIQPEVAEEVAPEAAEEIAPEGIEITPLSDGQYQASWINEAGETNNIVGTLDEIQELAPPQPTEEKPPVTSPAVELVREGASPDQSVWAVGSNERGDQILFQGTEQEAESQRQEMERLTAEQMAFRRSQTERLAGQVPEVMPTEDGQYAIHNPETGEVVEVFADEYAASIVAEQIGEQAELEAKEIQAEEAEAIRAEEVVITDELIDAGEIPAPTAEEVPSPEAEEIPAPETEEIPAPEAIELSPRAQEIVDANAFDAFLDSPLGIIPSLEDAHQSALDEIEILQERIGNLDAMPAEFSADLKTQVVELTAAADEIKAQIPEEILPEPSISLGEPAAEGVALPEVSDEYFRDEGGRFRSPTEQEKLEAVAPAQPEEPVEVEFDPVPGPTSETLPAKEVTVPQSESAKIFDAGKADLVVKAVDIAARKSPDESVARSKNKAEAALRGEYTPRKPLEVWEVTRPDGSKFYHLRDGNTTFQFLTSQGWTDFPVTITNRLPLAELTPPAEHKAVSLPGGWNGTKAGLPYPTKLAVHQDAKARGIDPSAYDVVPLAKGFRAQPKKLDMTHKLRDIPGEYSLPTTFINNKEGTPAFADKNDLSFLPPPEQNRFGSLTGIEQRLVASAVQHIASRTGNDWITPIHGFAKTFTNMDTASYHPRNRIIGVQRSFFEQINNLPKNEAMQHLTRVIAHEVWHDADMNGEFASISASSPMFDILHEYTDSGEQKKDGEIMEEVRDAYLPARRRIKNKISIDSLTEEDRKNERDISEFFAYPFDRERAILGGTKDFTQFKAEVFAQLGSLYLTQPDTMKEYLPKSYELFKQIEDTAYGKRDADRSGAIREALQAPDTPSSISVTGLSYKARQDQKGAKGQQARAGVEGEPAGVDGHRLEVERKKRVTKARAILTTAESNAIKKDAKAKGLDPEPLLKAAREYKKRFPVKDGWEPITAAGLMKDAKENNPASGIKWQAVRYNFHLDPETGKPTKKTYDARVEVLADKIVGEVAIIHNRAKAGNKNAKIILKHEGWYKNMIHRLREDFGATADLFADLLGAFSPNTDVKQNWQYAVEAMQLFSRGKFDVEMKAFEKWINAGNSPAKFDASNKIKRLNGKLFGMNSDKGMLAFLDLWRMVKAGTAPKARNFAGNLIGGTTRATIDVWAARFMRRLNGKRRIPPAAEGSVSGSFLVGSEDLKTGKIGGEYGFGADAFQQASDKLKEKGIDVEPMDLQAVVWFIEKEKWAKNNWTTETGEGGSFEEESDRNPLNRYVFGFSIQQEAEPTDKAMAAARKRLENSLTKDDNIIAYKVIPTVGRYAGWDERSFDVEITTAEAFTPDQIVGMVAKLAKENNQKDAFVSRIIKDKDEVNPNARPAAEIYLKTQDDLENLKPILDKMVDKKLDGFTFTVDPRKMLQLKKGETPSEFIGVRFQMVPEFTQRAIQQGWTTAEDNPEIASLEQSAILEVIDQAIKALDDVIAELRTMPEVAYAQAYSVDTLVIGQENYDDYITAKNRAANQKAGGQWFGQPLLAGLERSARRLGLEVDRGAVLRGTAAQQEAKQLTHTETRNLALHLETARGYEWITDSMRDTSRAFLPEKFFVYRVVSVPADGSLREEKVVSTSLNPRIATAMGGSVPVFMDEEGKMLDSTQHLLKYEVTRDQVEAYMPALIDAARPETVEKRVNTRRAGMMKVADIFNEAKQEEEVVVDVTGLKPVDSMTMSGNFSELKVNRQHERSIVHRLMMTGEFSYGVKDAKVYAEEQSPIEIAPPVPGVKQTRFRRVSDKTLNKQAAELNALKEKVITLGSGTISENALEHNPELEGEAETVIRPSVRPSLRFSVGRPIRKSALTEDQYNAVEADLKSKQAGRTVDQYYELAQADQDTLVRVGEELNEKLGEAGVFLSPGIKDRETTEEKIKDKGYADAGGMTDIVRGGFALKNEEDAEVILARLSEEFEVYDEGYNITPVGYSDRKIMVRFPNGTVGEIQIWETHMLQAKEGRKFTDTIIPDYMKDAWVRTDATSEQTAKARESGKWFPSEEVLYWVDKKGKKKEGQGGHALYEQWRVLHRKKGELSEAEIAEYKSLSEQQKAAYSAASRLATRAWNSAVETKPALVATSGTDTSFQTPDTVKRKASFVPSGAETITAGSPSQTVYDSTSESLNGLDIFDSPETPIVVTMSQVVKQLEDAVGADTVSELIRSGDFVVVERPADVREHMSRHGSKYENHVTADMQGLYDPSTDTAYIVASSLPSSEAAVGVFYHEVGAHYGLKKMLGEKQYSLIAGMTKRLGMTGDKALMRAMRRVNLAENLGIDTKKKGFGNRFMKQATPEQIEEVMGYLIEHNPEVTLAQRIIAGIKRFLASIGLAKLSEADVRAIIVSAARKKEGFATTSGSRPLFSKKEQSENYRNDTVYGLTSNGHVGALAWPNASGKWTVAFNRDSNGLPLQKGTQYFTYATEEQATREMEISGFVTQSHSPQVVQAIESEKFVDGLSTLSMSSWDWIVTKAQDKFHAVEKVQKIVEQERGEVSEAADVYMREALYHGRAEARQKKFHDEFIEPILAAIRKHKLSIAEVDNFLYARHAPEANARLKALNEDKKDNEKLSGMSNKEAAKIMKKFSSRKRKALENVVAPLFDAMNESRLNLMVDSGLITQELADTWRNTYEFYAPLMGFEEEIESQMPAKGKGFEEKGKEKRRFGRRSRAANILTHSVAMYEAQIVRSERNRVGRAMLNLANENPNTDFWSVNQPVYRKEIDKKTGLVKLVGESPKMRANVFVVKVDGVEHWVEFNPRNSTAMQIANSMKGLGNEQIGVVTGFLLKVNRYLSAINTSYNPEFIISNFTRDLQTAFINLQGTEAEKMKTSIIGDVRKSYTAIRRVQKGGIGRSKMKKKWNDYYKEFHDAGGQTGWVDNYKDINAREKALEKQLNAAKRGILNPMRLAKGVGEVIENLNMAVENAVRLSAYIHLRDAGASKDKAADVAKNLTVNFNRKGEMGTFLNALYLFYNAAIQGTARIFAAARHKKARRSMYAIVASSAILDMINRMRACDDEAGQNLYDVMPAYAKERQLIIMPSDCSGSPITIPMPYGYNVLNVIGQQIGAAAGSKEFDSIDAAGRIGVAMFGAFNPIGSEGTLGQMAAPTVLDPLLQVEQNKNWFGGTLVPDRFPGKGGTEIPQSQRYWASTRERSKEVASWLNELTGGDEARPGSIDISPAVLDMLFDQVTGGAGKFLANTENTLELMPEWAAGEEIDTNKVPFVRKIYKTRNKKHSTESFFKFNEDIAYTEEQLDTARAMKSKDRFLEIRRDQADKIKMIKFRTMVEKRIQNLNKKKKAAKASRIDDELKKQRVKEIDDQIFITRMNFIQRYRRIVLGME